MVSCNRRNCGTDAGVAGRLDISGSKITIILFIFMMSAAATVVVADTRAATKAGAVAIGISLKHALNIQYTVNEWKGRIRPSLVGDRW
jgi:hypothetical protein